MRLIEATRAIRNRISDAGLDVRSIYENGGRNGFRIAWRRNPRTAPAYVATVECFGTPIRFLVTNPKEYVSMHFMRGSFFAAPELKLVQEHYRGGTFLDAGANVGNHALFASVVLGAHVIAVEPIPEVYRLLRCNIALNDADVEHLPAGLSDGPGQASYTLSNPGNTGLGWLNDNPTGEITLVAGDEVCREHEIGFIKIDVEGMELRALHGLSETVARSRCPILVEVEPANQAEFDQIMADWRYETAQVLHGSTYLTLPKR
jgi:FkbM family methyltransferase